MYETIYGIIDKMPDFSFSSGFLDGCKNAIIFLVSIIKQASYVLPLDTFIICFGAMIIADNWSLIVKVIQWVIGLIRGM